MKKVLLTLLAAILVLGVFAAVGYTGYRLGYAQGAQGVQTTADGDLPRFRPFDNFGPRGMPMDRFGFEHGFPRRFGGFPMMGFGFFSPLIWLGRIAVLALILWFVYWLLTRSGWRLTREAAAPEAPPKPVETEAKE